MKEYKVLSAHGILNLSDRLTNIMNEMAIYGWEVKAMTSLDQGARIYVTFERDIKA
jgi:hypothetical protein